MRGGKGGREARRRREAGGRESRQRRQQRPAAPAKANGEFGVGTRIKYNDGNAWVSGVVASLEPTVLKFDDNTVIETSYDVLKAGAAEGIIVKQ